VQQNMALVLTWAVGCVLMSTFTLLPVVKIENSDTMCVTTSILPSLHQVVSSYVADTPSRTYGGLLMLLTAVLYLVFERGIMAQSKATRQGSSLNSLSRAVMGIQVCTSQRFLEYG
jgi:GPI ethanolamine phosphate transferase 1